MIRPPPALKASSPGSGSVCGSLNCPVHIATKSKSSRVAPSGVFNSSVQPGLPSARRAMAATAVLKRIRRSSPWLFA